MCFLRSYRQYTSWLGPRPVECGRAGVYLLAGGLLAGGLLAGGLLVVVVGPERTTAIPTPA